MAADKTLNLSRTNGNIKKTTNNHNNSWKIRKSTKKAKTLQHIPKSHESAQNNALGNPPGTNPRLQIYASGFFVASDYFSL
jgi:hypothetical protein